MDDAIQLIGESTDGLAPSRLTDAEVLRIYKLAFGRPEEPPDDHIPLVRQVITAKTEHDAAAILKHAGWYYPLGYSRALRQQALGEPPNLDSD
jgi:hypothetical protein